jgi:hypothetical protein
MGMFRMVALGGMAPLVRGKRKNGDAFFVCRAGSSHVPGGEKKDGKAFWATVGLIKGQ